MRMTNITLMELDSSAFIIEYGFDNPYRRGSVLFRDNDNNLPLALRRLRMLMSIHDIPSATIKTLTDGEREVTFEEVIHMRKSLTLMLKAGGEQ